MPNDILDPTGSTTERRPAILAARRDHLDGVTVGLLENTKQNAKLFLEELGRLLVDEHGAEGVVVRTKTAFALPVSPELREDLVSGTDCVVTGVGDCGSCSGSAVADGIAFERRGLPAAVICSDAFTVPADAMAELRGSPGYHYVTTAHPVAILSAEEVRARAVAVLPEVVAILTGRPGAHQKGTAA